MLPLSTYGEEWVWQSPEPTVSDLYAIWADSSSNIYCVGKGGTILHFDGGAWSAQDSATQQSLHAVWGAVWSNVFAGGDNGTLLHYNGLDWTPFPRATAAGIRSIWGASASAVFAAGSGGTLLYYNGSAWNGMQSNATSDLNGIWGTTSDDVFAVGRSGTIIHYDGTAWSAMQSGSTADLYAVCGLSSNKVFAVGSGGAILAYDGLKWSAVSSGGGNYHGIARVGETGLLAVGDDGRYARYEGSIWTESSSQTYATLYSAWAAASADIFACGDSGNIFRTNGAVWTSMTYITRNILYSVFGFVSSRYGRELYTCGENGVFFFRRDCEGAVLCTPTGAWVPRFQSSDLPIMYGLWGYTRYKYNYLYAAGAGGEIYFFDSRSDRWSRMDTGTDSDLRDVWGVYSGSADNNVTAFAVGDDGTIIYYNNSDWSSIQSGTTQNLQAVWGNAADTFCAVGNGGTILRYDGSGWQPMASSTAQNLRDVWGTASDNLYAVGKAGTILRYDGTSWSAMQSNTTVDLSCIWGKDSATIYAAGDSGLILRYDGKEWQPANTDMSSSFWSGLWGDSSGDFFFVGGRGAILGLLQEAPDPADGLISPIYPDNGAADVPLSLELQWSYSASLPADATFDIYLGTALDPPLAEAALTTASYSPPSLAYETTYYWKVVVKSAQGEPVAGPVWSFTTVSEHFIDKNFYTAFGFESSRYGREIFALGEEGAVVSRRDCGEGAVSCEPTGGWTLRTTNTSLKNIYGTWGYTVYKSNFLYTAGAQGSLYYYAPQDERWTQVETGIQSDLKGICGISYSGTEHDVELFAVGDAGTILHYRNDEVSAMDTAAASDLNAVWCIDTSTVYAVGNAGTILRYNGTTWQSMASGTAENLAAVWGSAPDNVYAVGSKGTIIRYDGAAWSSVASNTDVALNCIYGNGPESIFAAGDEGLILKYDGSSWRPIHSNSDTSWHAVWQGSSGAFCFAGQSGSLLTLLPPFDPSPSDNATDVPLASSLQWSVENPVNAPLTYDVYFGVEQEPPLVASSISLTAYSPGLLQQATTYYWRIVAQDANGEIAESPLWRFTTASNACAFSFLISDADKLSQLRQFRDIVLSKSSMGRDLISLYYGYSPAFVSFLTARPTIRFLLSFALNNFAE